MATAKKNEVTTKQESALAAVPENWGTDDAPVSAKEILIPKLLLMQGQSKLVANEQAKMGQFVNSVTGKVFGDITKPAEIIPIMKLPSLWVVSTVNGKDKKFKEIIPVTPANEDHDWNVKNQAGAVIEEWDYTMNYYVVMTDDVNGLPYQLAFRRTSLRAGKKLNNHFLACQMDKVAPARYAVNLSATKEMKDGKPYFIMDLIGEKRKSTDEEFATAFKWFQQLKSQASKFKVDDSDIVGEESASDVSEDSQY